MKDKIPVAVLGASGVVGQKFIELLADHPWFEIKYLTGSERSAGKKYNESLQWIDNSNLKEDIGNIRISETYPDLDCKVVFSALSGSETKNIEKKFAEKGYYVISNASCFRMDTDIPLIIPEVNHDHIGIIELQTKNNSTNGFIVKNPNCVAIPLSMVLHPLHKEWGIDEVFTVTNQAVSGGGYTGVKSMDILNNILPYIQGEEEKIVSETQKILGDYKKGKLNHADIEISAMTNRVPVLEGHMLSLSVKFKKKPQIAELKKCLGEYVSLPQAIKLPSAPEKPIIVFDENLRPQPRLDSGSGNGMSVSVGNIRDCSIFDYKFTILGNNLVRGAAGCAVLNSELLAAKELLQ